MLFRFPIIAISDFPVYPTLRLPDHILHLIFSYISFHDIVTKRWYRNTPSLLSFDESIFLSENKRNMKFSDWILDSLETSKSMLIKAEKRILSIQFISFHHNVINFKNLMDENNFHEVYLKLNNSLYFLPHIFQSHVLVFFI